MATEVRNLAQRIAAAAKEIKELIDDSVEKVTSGTRLVDEAGTTMNEVIGRVRRVTDLMVEIQAASQEQSAGIGQVNQAIGQMNQVTQQNAALVEQAAAAAESLQDQAAKLSQVVSVFKVNGMASGTRTTALKPKTGGMQRTPVKISRPVAQRPATETPKLAAKSPVTAGGEWEEF